MAAARSTTRQANGSASASTRIHVIREVHDSPDGVSHGIEEIEGAITGIDATSRVGDPLVLTLEDGRKLDFYFEDSSGTFIARGDLRPAKE